MVISMKKIVKILFLIFNFYSYSKDNLHIDIRNNSSLLTSFDSESNIETIIHVVPLINKNSLISNSDAWYSFHSSAFDFFELLEKEKNSNKPIVIIMHKEFNGYSPIDSRSAWIEGGRVALAWGSAYFRFSELGNLDIRVLLFENVSSLTLSNIKKAVAQIASLQIEQNLDSPEENMKKRIFDFEDILRKNTSGSEISLDYYQKKNMNLNNKVLEPKFKDLAQEKQRMVITGGAGFIGSFMVKELLKQGHQVIAIDNLLCGSLDNLEEVKDHKNFMFINFDVTQPFDITGPITSIVHLASAPSPMFYYTKPKETLMSGLHGTKNTLELALRKKSKYLFASSSEVYGDPEFSPQSEDYVGRVNPIGKRSQYDQSKRGGETLIKLYFERYGIDVRIARIFNTYGPNMNIGDGRVVTNFIAAVLENRPLTIYGNGLQTRSFAYVTDTVSGLLKILQSNDISSFNTIEKRIFNVGNPEEFTINHFAQKIDQLAQKYLGRQAIITHIELPDIDDPKIRKPDIQRAQKIVGFNPIITVDEGLEKTFVYFKKSKRFKKDC